MLEITNFDRANIVATVHTDGFKALQKVFEIELEKFQQKALNSDPANVATAMANLSMARAATLFYQGIVDRINNEVTIYQNAPRASDVPVDATEGVLDLDGLGAMLEDVPNFYGSVEGALDE